MQHPRGSTFRKAYSAYDFLPPAARKQRFPRPRPHKSQLRRTNPPAAANDALTARRRFIPRCAAWRTEPGYHTGLPQVYIAQGKKISPLSKHAGARQPRRQPISKRTHIQIPAPDSCCCSRLSSPAHSPRDAQRPPALSALMLRGRRHGHRSPQASPHAPLPAATAMHTSCAPMLGNQIRGAHNSAANLAQEHREQQQMICVVALLRCRLLLQNEQCGSGACQSLLAFPLVLQPGASLTPAPRLAGASAVVC